MTSFKISTNIERDSGLDLDYIVTKNANEVYERILYNVRKGQNSFSIIGSYGTGKSTFLWAFEAHCKGVQKFNHPYSNQIDGVHTFEFKKIVGEPASFKRRFCEALDLEEFSGKPNRTILTEFAKQVKEYNSRGSALVVLVDEFGKHLEYIAKADPEEMYFIQELAEFCNDTNRRVIFITTLHQNFSVYARELSQAEKSEWDKVKGRLVDITFNEPVDQLLFFAAKRLKRINIPSGQTLIFKEAIKIILDSGLLGRSSISSKSNMEELYPLDPLAGHILTSALQRYGQNERSLFSFLESKELNKAIDKKGFFSVADCFDYLIENLVSEIEDGEKNPFKPQWKAVILALEKVEFLFEEDYFHAAVMLKAVGLINIFGNAAGRLDKDVLVGYSETVLGVSNAANILTTLVDRKVLKYSKHRNKYNFLDGTDVDIEKELQIAARHIDEDIDVVSRLSAYFNFGVIPAKRFQFDYGTPRFFNFKFLSDLSISDPSGEVDGHINLIFTKKRILGKLKSLAEASSPNQIFVLFKDVDPIKSTLFELDKIEYVCRKWSDDKIALRLLNEERLFRTRRLREFVEGALFSDKAKVTWIWNERIDALNNGEKKKINSLKALNQLLSDSAEVTFHSTPVYRNEMVNKEVLSSPIRTARKALIRQMISHGDEVDLGFEDKHFPPQKTIYLSLLKNTGIHRQDNSTAFFTEPSDTTFLPIWDESIRILKESQNTRISVTAFYDALVEEPFKLKRGFLDFWVPIFLIIKKEDYSLYHADEDYIPHLTSDVLDLIYKNPAKYFIKALSVEGIKQDYFSSYKELIGYNESNVKGLESSYITIYGNFLKFYRGLEDFTKKTRTAMPKEAIGVRDAIANAKDPESALFQLIPEALGYYGVENSKVQLESFLKDLKQSIRQIRLAYDSLVNALQTEIIEYFDLDVKDFIEFKAHIVNRFKAINKNLILNDQLRLFYVRLTSPLDVKRAYWESLCDATLGKKLNKISDDEIRVLLDRMIDNIEALTKLLDVHSIPLKKGEDVLQFSLMDRSGHKNYKESIVVKEKDKARMEKMKSEMSIYLSSDKGLNRAALISLLEEQIRKA